MGVNRVWRVVVCEAVRRGPAQPHEQIDVGAAKPEKAMRGSLVPVCSLVLSAPPPPVALPPAPSTHRPLHPHSHHATHPRTDKRTLDLRLGLRIETYESQACSMHILVNQNPNQDFHHLRIRH